VAGFSFTGPDTAKWSGGIVGTDDSGVLSDDVMSGNKRYIRFKYSFWRFHHNFQKNGWKLGQLARIQ
jgi:hypothetical protein